MQADVLAKRLKPLVRATTTVAKHNDNRPILRNVLLTAADDGLEITATDTVVGLWLKIPLQDDEPEEEEEAPEGVTEESEGAEAPATETEDEEEEKEPAPPPPPPVIIGAHGAVAVSAQDLHRVLNTIKSDRVTVSLSGSICRVEGGNAKFSLVTEDPRDFPTIKRFSARKPFVRVTGQVLTDMLARSVYCAHNEVSFYLMHGLLVKYAEGTLYMVATDGRRLGVCSSKCEHDDDEFSAEIVIPASIAPSLKKVIGDPEELVDIQWTSRSLNVRGSLGEASVVALNGRFPDYRRGVPNNTKKIEFERTKLTELLRQTQAFKSSHTTLVRLQIQDGKLVFSGDDPAQGSMKIDFEIEWPHPPLDLIANTDFMLQSATTMKSPSLVLELGDQMTATVLRELRDDLDSFCVYAVARL